MTCFKMWHCNPGGIGLAFFFFFAHYDTCSSLITAILYCGLFPRQPRGPIKRHPPIRANTADEAIEKMLEQKKISNKINYDVLKDLNIKPGASPARQAETPKKEPSATKLTGRNRQPARVPLSLSTPLSTLGKRSVDGMFYTCEQVNQSGVCTRSL